MDEMYLSCALPLRGRESRAILRPGVQAYDGWVEICQPPLHWGRFLDCAHSPPDGAPSFAILLKFQLLARMPQSRPVLGIKPALFTLHFTQSHSRTPMAR
ncbi:MAG: hypothetical protein E6K53_05560 [Gammaproteobacteria bacterium]|nr:MAG: hypothetical protein E6K53_05560 [Gammaproteobacteria bacterium]